MPGDELTLIPEGQLCAQTLSWPLSLIKTALAGRWAPGQGRKKPILPKICTLAASRGGNNLDSSQDSWSLKPTLTMGGKKKRIIQWNLGSFLLEAPFSSFLSPKKGVQIKDNARNRALEKWKNLVQ